MSSHDSTVEVLNDPLVEDLLQQFQLDGKQVNDISRNFLKQMSASGIHVFSIQTSNSRLDDGLNHTRSWQLPSYVYQVPNGSEKGTFLAVDLGGTNCRICLVDLLGNSKYNVKQTKHAVPEHVRINPSYEPLFSFIAGSISRFLDQNDLGTHAGSASTDKRIPLGFTFSFTFEQTAIACGTLIQWDKGWDIPEAIGKDPCAMLQEFIDALKLPVRVVALANDSVGTLLSRAYTSQGCGSTLAGVIVGTGTNAAYMEKLCNIPRLEDSEMNPFRKSIILNTEWGCFDDDLQVLPITPYDRALDAASTNPGNQQLEKRVSGMYLGELMRLVILHCQDQGIFNMILSSHSPCNYPYGLDSSFLSLLATRETASSLNIIEAIERVLLARDVTLRDIDIMEKLSEAIVRRSARLVGTALGAIIIQSGRLTTPLSEKITSQFSSEKIQHDGSPSTSQKRGCGLLAKVAIYFKSITARATKPTQNPFSGTLEIFGSTEQETIDIGVEGSLIELYPGFEAYIRSALVSVKEIGSEGEGRIKMGLAMDGSSVGAALIANAAISICR